MKTLSVFQLSSVALAAGMDMGFNAAEVERYCDAEGFDLRIAVTFGDREQMDRQRLRTPCEWARSYTEELPCIREPRRVAIPPELADRSASEICAYLTGQLLELV